MGFFVFLRKKCENHSYLSTYSVEVIGCKNTYRSQKQNKSCGSSIKSIAEATGIKANTLYKWKTTPVHLSPEKADCLLFYLMKNEPARLELAEKVVCQQAATAEI